MKQFVYLVYHVFDIDGGFGDAITTEEFIEAFENEDDAHAFVEIYDNEHVYDIPYDELRAGRLEVRKVELAKKEVFKDYYWDDECFRPRLLKLNKKGN